MFAVSRVLCKSALRQTQFKNTSVLVAAYSSSGNKNKQELNSPSESKHDSPDTISNEPINFFGSQAAKWRAKDSRSGGSDQALWYQPYVISGSLAVFLIYFCILREESDIDRKLEGNLYEHVSGLEEVALSVNYKYNKEHGLDTREQENRLKELGVDIKQLS